MVSFSLSTLCFLLLLFPPPIKTQWTIKSFILQSSHIMILNSTKFGGNRTKYLEVGPDRQTDRKADSYIRHFQQYFS
jgi:hypothetical protein